MTSVMHLFLLKMDIFDLIHKRDADLLCELVRRVIGAAEGIGRVAIAIDDRLTAVIGNVSKNFRGRIRRFAVAAGDSARIDLKGHARFQKLICGSLPCGSITGVIYVKR